MTLSILYLQPTAGTGSQSQPTAGMGSQSQLHDHISPEAPPHHLISKAAGNASAAGDTSAAGDMSAASQSHAGPTLTENGQRNAKVKVNFAAEGQSVPRVVIPSADGQLLDILCLRYYVLVFVISCCSHEDMADDDADSVEQMRIMDVQVQQGSAAESVPAFTNPGTMIIHR